jgi:hypothetical protein
MIRSIDNNSRVTTYSSNKTNTNENNESNEPTDNNINNNGSVNKSDSENSLNELIDANNDTKNNKKDASTKKPSSWTNRGMPSDITWPSPYEPGALPITDFRNKRFKLIPCVIEGPWVVQMAVRATPVLLGQKVAQRYYRGDQYMEICVDVGSSMIAAQIVGLCRGYTKSFSTNLAIVIQGEADDELPEQLLACVCLKRIDVEVRSKLTAD